MAPISLPLSFNNSFWSNDYRRGLRVLYDKLEQVSDKIPTSYHANPQLRASQRTMRSSASSACVLPHPSLAYAHSTQARALAENNIAASLLNAPATGRASESPRR